MPNPIASVAQTFGEVVVTPTKDEVGQMIEQGVSQALGASSKPLDPEEEARKKAEDERKKKNIILFLQRYNQDRQNLVAQRQREELERQRKLQEEQEKKTKVRQIEVLKKQRQQTVAVQQAQTRAERKGGVGG